MTDPIEMGRLPGRPAARQPAGKSGSDKEDLRLKKACADFESVFLYQLLKTMRRTIPSGGALNRSAGQDTYTMMLDQKIAEEFSRRGDGLGIQKVLYEQLKKNPQGVTRKD